MFWWIMQSSFVYTSCMDWSLSLHLAHESATFLHPIYIAFYSSTDNSGYQWLFSLLWACDDFWTNGMIICCNKISPGTTRIKAQGESSSLLRCQPGNREAPGSMPGWGFLLLLFPWARNFTPIASCSFVEERLVDKHKSLSLHSYSMYVKLQPILVHQDIEVGLLGQLIINPNNVTL